MENNGILYDLLNVLDVKQTYYKGPYNNVSNTNIYPVEYEYLNRCLMNLGDIFMDYKIVKTKNGTILECLNEIYKIDINKKYKNNIPEDDILLDNKLSKELDVNILLIGPEIEQIRLYKSKKNKLYIIIYRSYEELYYPIISLIEKEHYVFCKENNQLIRDILEILKNK